MSLTVKNRHRCLWLSCCLLALSGAGTLAQAHDTHHGDLLLDHPYAVPSLSGESHGKAYLRGITNAGTKPERLLSASTPIAAKVALHSLKPDAKGLIGHQVETIDLPAKAVTKLRHTGDYQLTLIDLKQPLKDGDRFDLTLNFELAGRQTVKVWVQQPRDLNSGEHKH